VIGQYPVRRRRRWWLLPVLAVLVVALGGGVGFGLRELAARANGDVPSTSGPSPTTATTSRGDEPGSPVVQLAPDVAADPRSEEIRQLLQRHFDAINSRDFDDWQTTVTRRRAAEYPKSQWQFEYQSTRDGSILVHRVEPVQGGSVVLLSFTSMQEPHLAPDRQSDCLRWRVSYSIVLERGELRLGQSDPKASQFVPC
jgi:hypothetical protein